MNSDATSTEKTVGELAEIVPHLAEMMSETMHANRCAVFVYSEDQQSTIALFRYGYDEADEEAHSWTDPLNPLSIPAERYMLETMQPLVRSSPDDFARYPLVNPGQERREGRLTDLSVPLVWNERVQGSACLWRTNDPSVFTETEIERALDLGRLMAMTIVFARSYESERLQGQRLDSLLNVASVSTSGQGLDDVLQVLAKAVRDATDADICSLYVFDESVEQVLAAYQDGMRPEEVEMFESTWSIVTDDVPAEVRMRETLKPHIIRDFRAELSHDTPLANYVIEQNPSEILLLPIVWHSDFLGAIYSWYRRTDRQFSTAAIETAAAIAQQAGGVVARARLEATLAHQSLENDALLRIGQAVLASETLAPVLDEIAMALEQLIPFNYANVSMVTADRQHVRVIREWGESYKSILGTKLPVDASMTGSAVREGKLVTTTHILNDPRAWEGAPASDSLHSVMVAPLSHDNHISGTLFLARTHAQRFTPREEQLLTLLSNQAALAIERVNSREEMTRRVERQSLLARVGDLLVSTEETEQALQRIADLAVGVVADGVIFGLAGWEYGSLRWVADSFDDPQLAERLHRGLHNLDMEMLRERLEYALVSNRELAFPLTNIWAEHRFLRDFVESLGVNYLLVIPLFQQDRAPGLMILLTRSDDSPFRDDEVQLGRIIAQRIGDALERQQVKRYHEGLLRISEALYAQSDTEDLFGTISVELNRMLPSDQLIIADVEHEQGMLRTKTHRKGSVELPPANLFSIDQGICGEAIRLRKPIMDNQADLRESSVYSTEIERRYYRREGESVLATPLIVEDEAIGVVFVNRPGHFRFTTVEFETFLLFAGLASAALDRTTLEQHNRDLYRASTEVLSAVVDAKDPMTQEHSRHVAVYSRELARLMELPSEQVERIELAGLLHDIGKLGIPDRVLQKPGRLTDEEFALIKTHPDRGARILQWHPALEDLIPMVRHHHESQNGRGYPAGLTDDQIPIGASIICIADAFDTITSERNYQRRRSVEAALEELERCAGSQFHPELVKRFVARIKEDPTLLQVDQPSDV